MIADPTIEEAVRALILQKCGNVAELGGRVYLSENVPAGVDPKALRVTLLLLSEVPEQSAEGDSGLARVTMAVMVYSAVQSECIQLSRVIAKRLNRTRGLYGGVYIQGLLKMTRVTLPMTDAGGRPSGIFGQQTDFEVWFEDRVKAT